LLKARFSEHFQGETFAKFVQVKHAIAVNNGTTAFLLVLQTLDLKPDDEVIMSPFAPIAASELVRALGAVPKFVDVAERGLHLSPELLPQAITERTRAGDGDVATPARDRGHVQCLVQPYGRTATPRRSLRLATCLASLFAETEPPTAALFAQSILGRTASSWRRRDRHASTVALTVGV
jgi:hypothetical protein